MTKTTNSTYIMKKIYLFLLATILPALSINAANIVFTNNPTYSHVYTWNNGYAGSHNTLLDLGVDQDTKHSPKENMKFYYSNSSFNRCIFESNNNFGNQSDDLEPDGYTSGNDNMYFKTYWGSWYSVKLGLRGQWDGSSWSNIYFTKKSGSNSIYETPVQIYPNATNISFGLGVYETNAGSDSNSNKSWAGYNTTYTKDNLTGYYSVSGNSNIQLSPGYKYHFEFNFSDRTLKMIIDEVPIPTTMYLIDSSRWDNNSPGTGTNFSKDSSGKIFTLNNVFMMEDQHFKITSSNSKVWDDANANAYGINEDNNDYELKNTLNNVSVTCGKAGAFKTTVTGMYTFKIDFTTPASPKLTVSWAASNLSLTPTVDNISYTTADIKYSLTTSNVPTSGVTYSVKCSNYPAQTSTSGTFNLTGLESNKDQTFTIEAVAMYSGVTIASDKQTVTFKTLEEPKTAVEDVVIDAQGYNFEGRKVSSENEAAYYIVTLSSQTAGANIYYTLDGSDPDDKSIAYSVQPFMVPNSCTVRAVAYVGQNTSNVSEKELVINSSANYTWDDVADKGQRAETVIVDTKMGGLTVSNTKVLTLNLVLPEGCEGEYIWTKYEDYSKYAEGGTWADQNDLVDHLTGDDEHDSKPFVLDNNHTNSHDCRNFENAYYRCYFQLAPAAVQGKSKVASASKIDPSQTRIAFSVLMESNATGIDEITVDTVNTDDSEAPVVYYNLQGVRVANPSHGLYIRVQGATSSKVFIK